MTKDETLAAFKTLKNGQELASLLGVNHASLNYWAYKAPEEKKYKSFVINKKDGSFREIKSPLSGLRYIQSKLKIILDHVYDTKGKPAHGFIKSRSIATNAAMHANRKFVFNLDLQDFFPSINFGRVRGMFMKWPYELPTEVASVIAQLVVSQNKLPQGGITSPVISNMVCSSFDKSLAKFAKENHCLYSRYADDITFSTNRSSFPVEIAVIDPNGKWGVGDGLIKVIEAHPKGFKINSSKVRMHRKIERQEVTGLVVNEKVNIKRKYVRQIRAMLHAWDKYGLEAAQVEFNQKYSKKKGQDLNFDNVIRGKLAYLKMIRGSTDDLLRKLVKKYNSLTKGKPIELPPEKKENLKNATWIVETPSLNSQGSAFVLDGVGFVSCEHVIRDDSVVSHASDLSKKYKIKIERKDVNFDLVIFSCDAPILGKLVPSKQGMKEGSKIMVSGYPRYKLGNPLWITDGKVNGFAPQNGVMRALISGTNIISGMSGGAIMNENYEVLGIGVRGAPGHDEGSDTARHEVILLSTLSELK